VIERRARWERALNCTRTELLLGIYCAAILLGVGIALRPESSTGLVAVAGLSAGLIVHVCNRLALAQPPFRRRIDWESDPQPASSRRSNAATFLITALTILAIGCVYLATGRTWTTLIAFFGGSFLAYALIALGQRVYLERDFVRNI
jgi:hypothetical protein